MSVERNNSHIMFGLIADVQYADIEDGMNFTQTRKRYYRTSLNLLRHAISDWKQSNHDLAFVLQFGDLIDGLNKRGGGDKATITALQAALEPFRTLSCPVYHMIGNHDLYNYTRKQCLASELNSSTLPGVVGVEGGLYYSVIVHPQLKIIVLDTYEISILGFDDCPEHPNFKTATAILDKHNPNEEKNSSSNVHGEAKRYVAFNGGLGKQQLDWLDTQLTEAEERQQNVLICGHVQLVPMPSLVSVCAVWNYHEVLSIIHSHNCVIICLAGHDHDGILTVDLAGIHHLVLNGVIETPPDTNAYATAFLHQDMLEIKGSGSVPSITVPLKFHINSS